MKSRTSFYNAGVGKNLLRRFYFLYLEDTITAEQRRQKTIAAIKNFFNV